MTASRWKRFAFWCAGAIAIVAVMTLTLGMRPGRVLVAGVVGLIVASVIGLYDRPADDRTSGKPSV